MRRVTLPREHGAYLILGGAIAAAVLIAPHPAAACAVGAVIVAAFFARAIAERMAAAAPLRAWDREWAIVLVAAVVAGLALVARTDARLAGGLGVLAIAGVIAAAVMRRRRRHRNIYVELGALGALGASGGVAAFAGGAADTTALVLGAILAVHAAGAVPLVRSAVRGGRAPGAALVIVLVAAAVAGAVVVGRPAAALALAPRLVQLAARRFASGGRADPRRLGLVETALLVAIVALLALTL